VLLECLRLPSAWRLAAVSTCGRPKTPSACFPCRGSDDNSPQHKGSPAPLSSPPSQDPPRIFAFISSPWFPSTSYRRTTELPALQCLRNGPPLRYDGTSDRFHLAASARLFALFWRYLKPSHAPRLIFHCPSRPCPSGWGAGFSVKRESDPRGWWVFLRCFLAPRLVVPRGTSKCILNINSRLQLFPFPFVAVDR